MISFMFMYGQENYVFTQIGGVLGYDLIIIEYDS